MRENFVGWLRCEQCAGRARVCSRVCVRWIFEKREAKSFDRHRPTHEHVCERNYPLENVPCVTEIKAHQRAIQWENNQVKDKAQNL